MVYTTLISLHALAATILVGNSLLLPLLLAEVRGASTSSALLRWLDFTHRVTRFNPVAAAAVIATGIYLATVGEWWSWGWMYVTIVLFISNSVLAGRVIEPLTARLRMTTAATDTDVIGSEIDALRWSRRWDVTSSVVLGGDCAMLVLMFAKPPLVVSIVIAIATNAVVAGTLRWGKTRGTKLRGATRPAT